MELFLGSLLIFVLRIGDVGIASVRIVTLMRGKIWLAALLGFFESLFWVSAAAIVFTNLDHPIRIISFAAGFATGSVLTRPAFSSTNQRVASPGACSSFTGLAKDGAVVKGSLAATPAAPVGWAPSWTRSVPPSRSPG